MTKPEADTKEKAGSRTKGPKAPKPPAQTPPYPKPSDKGQKPK